METGLFENMRIRGEKPLIFILSGAGLSAESGIPTFRDRDGLWEKYDFRELATSEAIKKTPEKVFEFYNARITMFKVAVQMQLIVPWRSLQGTWRVFVMLFMSHRMWIG